MAKKNNDKDAATSGFGTIEIIPPVNPPADPGAKDHNNLADWIRKDMAYKEYGTPRIKYS
jgi:hypothetical protein